MLKRWGEQIQDPTQHPGHRARASDENVRRATCTSSIPTPSQAHRMIQDKKTNTQDQLTKPHNRGTTLAGFGVAGVIFGLQFFAEVPKVRKDILQVRPLPPPPPLLPITVPALTHVISLAESARDRRLLRTGDTAER